MRTGCPSAVATITTSLIAMSIGACSLVRVGAPSFDLPVSNAPLATSRDDMAFIDRLTWGGNTATAQIFAQDGRAKFLERQLTPTKDGGLPQSIERQIDSLAIEHQSVQEIVAKLNEERAAIKKAEGTPASADVKKAYQETLNDLANQARTRSLLRDLYSQDQLEEQMTWFWFNHFSVSANKGDIRAFIGDYEEHAIRPHVFGRFRDLLAATMRHPAMLIYLDNAQNAAGHINENYARELMELHTLGVSGGYTQQDVQELARILTGVGINQSGTSPNVKRELKSQYVRDGLFEFNPNRHDYGDKIFLGRVIKGSGLAETEQAIDIVANDPATAKFVCRKIALFFVSDSPSDELVARMAATFRTTGGSIAEVLRTLFASPEFAASLHQKFKDPMHFVMSAVRLTYENYAIVNTAPLENWLNRLSEPLYGHETPDGFPLGQASWSGSGDMNSRFEIARIIGSGHTNLFKPRDSTAPEPAMVAKIEASRYFQAIRTSFSATTQAALAQSKSVPDFNMLFLSSPEFMHR